MNLFIEKKWRQMQNLKKKKKKKKLSMPVYLSHWNEPLNLSAILYILLYYIVTFMRIIGKPCTQRYFWPNEGNPA